jgi:energy-coupling factor transport system substrate-specific component
VRAAVGLGLRARVVLAVSSILALLAFVWPLIVATPPTGPEQTGGLDASAVFMLVLPALLVLMLAELSAGGIDAKALAMLGVLSAIGAALRPLGAGTAGIEPSFFLLILAGRVFGPAFGFLLGSTTLFASALLTGGVGPWLPFQMLAASWVGLGAGLLPPAKGRWEIALLMAYGAIAAAAFGLLMNLWFWPFLTDGDPAISYLPGAPIATNLGRLLVYSAATSLAWDVGRAITTVLLVGVTGSAILAVLRRAVRRAAFGAAPVFGA